MQFIHKTFKRKLKKHFEINSTCCHGRGEKKKKKKKRHLSRPLLQTGRREREADVPVRGVRGQASTADRQLDNVSQGLRCGQTSSLPRSGNLKEKGKFVRVEMKRSVTPLLLLHRPHPHANTLSTLNTLFHITGSNMCQ